MSNTINSTITTKSSIAKNYDKYISYYIEPSSSSVISNNSLHNAYNSFQSAYRAIKTAGTWVGKANNSAINVCEDIRKYFYALDDQFTKLDNSVKAYLTLQDVAADLAKAKYEKANDTARISVVDPVTSLQNAYNDYLKLYNEYISDYVKYTVNSSGYGTLSFINNGMLKVDNSLIENILENLEKCISYLDEFLTDCSNTISKAVKKNVGFAYSKYYSCVTYSNSGLNIIKSNTNSLKNEVRKFKSRVASFVQRISNFENSKMSVNLQKLVENSSYEDDASINEGEESLSKSGSASAVFDNVDDVVVSDEINASDYEIGGLGTMLTYEEVGATNWAIDCEQMDLNDLDTPLSSMHITAFPTSDHIENVYTSEGYKNYVNNGSYVKNTGNAYHDGTDFKASTGTTVSSISSGVVVSTGYSGAAGNMVVVVSEVVDEDGKVSYYRTRYQHLSSIKVKAGDIIDNDTVVGLSGGTGGWEPHLHVDCCKLNISDSDMEDCDSTEEVIKIYNKSSTVDNSYVNLGAYYSNTGKTDGELPNTKIG